MAWEAAVRHTASSGRVVLAMEHRDGTGCACVASDRPIYYYKEHDVVVDDINKSEEMAPLPFRADQLEFRREEIYTAYRSFCDFLKDDLTSNLNALDNQPIERSSWTSVCFDKNVTLAGHSFGGCTVLSILSSNPPPEYLHIPISHALIFDPWLEPLPLPTPIPISPSHNPTQLIAQSANANPNNSPQDKSQDGQAGRDGWLPQMLVINSEVFTLWKDHYTRLESVVKAWEPQGGRLLTLGKFTF
ncbi:hypothetical protein C0992_007760 [Termitomyces sp. T32_za158]|nr:hypothetical protein C0992_007760 [Termitomyces sp. T32_za158]